VIRWQPHGRRRWLRPSQLAEKVWQIDLGRLWEQGVRGLILDLDNTLVPWNQEEVAPEVAAWVEAATARGLRACVVSNALRGARVQRVAERLGLAWVVRAGKPLPRAFRRGLKVLGTAPRQTCAIGDQVFTDMLGANWLGLVTVLVAPLSAVESPHTRLIRRVERPLRRRWRREQEGESATDRAPRV